MISSSFRLRIIRVLRLGLISFDAPRDGLRPDRATIEALEIFAAQASLAIANHSRFAELANKSRFA